MRIAPGHEEDTSEPPDRPDWSTLEEFAKEEGDDELIGVVVDVVRPKMPHARAYETFGFHRAFVTEFLYTMTSPKGADLFAALDALGWREAVEQAINDRPAPSASDEP